MKDQRGEWRVTPAFDLPSSAVYGDRTMVLPIGGRIRQQLSWPMLRTLAEAVGLPVRLAVGAVREQTEAAAGWSENLDELPFDPTSVRNLRRLLLARIRHIQPE